MREISIFKKRILLYADKMGISKYEIYQNTGISNGIFSQKGGLSEDNLLKFLSYYTDISPEWLLTGEGEMLKPEKNKGEFGGSTPHISKKMPENAPYDIKAFTDLIAGFTGQIGNLHEQLGAQANENRHLHEINMRQAARIAELEREIENLEEEVRALKKESESIERIQGAAYPYVAEPTPASFVKKPKKTKGIPDFQPPPSNPKHPKMR